MAHLLPLAPLGIAIVGIGGAAPYCGFGAPCAPQPPFVLPIGILCRFVPAEPDQPIVDEKLPSFLAIIISPSLQLLNGRRVSAQISLLQPSRELKRLSPMA
jgi:hypothetical protein